MRYVMLDPNGAWALVDANLSDRALAAAQAAYDLIAKQWLKVGNNVSFDPSRGLPVKAQSLPVARPVLFDGSIVAYKCEGFYCGEVYDKPAVPLFWSLPDNAKQVLPAISLSEPAVEKKNLVSLASLGTKNNSKKKSLCVVSQLSSRICVLGTKGCTIKHRDIAK